MFSALETAISEGVFERCSRKFIEPEPLSEAVNLAMCAFPLVTSQQHLQESLTARVGIITVTYDSELFVREYLSALSNQTLQSFKIVVIDTSPEYPERLFSIISQTKLPIVFEWVGQVGFCAGNNIGWSMVKELPYILFLNPDAFLSPDFLERAIAYMESQPAVGMVAPTLLRYDINSHRPLDVIDTTGVVRNWYGNLFERDSNSPISVLERYKSPNEIPWACAAAVLARREALEDVVQRRGEIFDESFFMYKEDTDLSWRIRRAGWRIIHHPDLLGYHCRGWKDRKSFSRKLRLLCARNEMKAGIKNHSPFALLSLIKYVAVLMFDL